LSPVLPRHEWLVAGFWKASFANAISRRRNGPCLARLGQRLTAAEINADGVDNPAGRVRNSSDYDSS
jgi:hypothetical protein